MGLRFGAVDVRGCRFYAVPAVGNETGRSPVGAAQAATAVMQRRR
ncbi:hypothetical protein GLE_3986 [Lysobacter enzymogenes]|uniref:Uncharacterized protein n=1 Tax=Lysobacter enzymogenes TaxID=69 RepID=A0A0S2DLF8_LYSEN|nr:hypothetical protein GLE_3986 [Lysobacter enzymogenes]